MTFSIVGRDAAAGQWGVAVASKFLAVGAAVPTAAVGVGAIATQAFANLGYLESGLAFLRDGLTPADVVAALTGPDERRSERQVGIVGGTGDGASFTGEDCISWAGHRTGDGYAIQGNCLTGPDVVEACESAYRRATGPLARRLLAALVAGDESGGDKRGRQSAALLVVSPGGGYGGGSDLLVDLRVDDHAAPVPELARLLDLHDLYFGKPDPATVLPVDDTLRAEIDRHLQGVGHTSLWDWMGVENLEERWLDDDHLDPVVLAVLRQQDTR